MKELKEKLNTLCIFRELLKDSVISSLCAYMENPTSSAYAEFVAALYNANGGNLGEYVKELCWNSENVYVKMVGLGKDVPNYLYFALVSELDTLQEITELNKETLTASLQHKEFLPEFTTTKLRLKEIYLHRAENIDKYGYGIYAKYNMFSVDEAGNIVPVRHPDKTELSDLVDYESERKVIVDNTKALLDGKPAANILLTGDAGTGKSWLSLSYLFSKLEAGDIDKIIIFCNTVATAGSAKLGYYPGSRTEKLLDSQIGNFLISKLGDRTQVERLINETLISPV